jgi:hypothetical protein
MPGARRDDKTGFAMAASTTSGLYVSQRGNFHYVASWEFADLKLKWTAVVRSTTDPSKLLIGECALNELPVDLGALVRRQVEERIDRQGWTA